MTSVELSKKRIDALRSGLKASYSEFEYNIDRVENFANFDKEYQNVALDILNTTQKSIPDDLKHSTEKKRLAALISSFENMSKDKRLKEKYETMYNQCLVLLVSHFAEALSEIYKRNIAKAVRYGLAIRTGENEVKIIFGELFEVDFGDDNGKRSIRLSRRNLLFCGRIAAFQG